MHGDWRFPTLLGAAGLLPFWGLAVAASTGATFGYGRPAVLSALATYAATIASFLGGIRWGLSVRDPEQSRVRTDYAVSVLPQLAAWAALALDGPLRMAALGTVLLVTGPLDLALVRRGLAPAWFGRLRLALSLLSSASLVLAATV